MRKAADDVMRATLTRMRADFDARWIHLLVRVGRIV